MLITILSLLFAMIVAAVMLVVPFIEQIIPTLLMLVIFCPIITAFLTKKVTSAWGARLISWLVPLVYCLASYFIKFNTTFEGWELWQVIVMGVLTGLVTNGIYSVDEIKSALDAMSGRKELKHS